MHASTAEGCCAVSWNYFKLLAPHQSATATRVRHGHGERAPWHGSCEWALSLMFMRMGYVVPGWSDNTNFQNGHSRSLFLYFHLFNIVERKQMFNKFRRRLGSNRGSLVSEGTALPTEPRPLPDNTNLHLTVRFKFDLVPRSNYVLGHTRSY